MNALRRVLAVFALMGTAWIVSTTVDRLAVAPPRAKSERLIATPSPVALLTPDFAELPRQELSPGAVRVSSVAPVPQGCPTSLVLDELPPPGCSGPATEQEVCATRSTRPFRHSAGVTKRSVCAAYGISREECPKVEDDHLIPLELGGSDARENHWPQPWGGEWGATEKDWLENRLRHLVCSDHALSLERAQRCIAEEWTLCYAQARRGDFGKMGATLR